MKSDRSTLPVISPARPSFERALSDSGASPLTRERVTTLQINVGKRCNQACHHCHVDAGPKRTESMTDAVAERVIELLRATSSVTTVDITGGAPELNANFRRLVRAAREHGVEAIDRCNLTVLFEPGQEDTAAFLAERRVRVVASMPCYSADNVDQQRGKGVFDKSIRALQHLGELGYGIPGSGLILDLVYNPVGAFLPPAQAALEADYKAALERDFGIRFNSLLTITNMPIKRFAHMLERRGLLEEYMCLLVQSFNADTVPALMCRHQISVGHDGALYDCDFNQMLELGLPGRDAPRTIWDVEHFDVLADAPIATDSHCFGCTAGTGSSCGGALQS